MSWKEQIKHVNLKLQKSIGIISKIRYLVPKHLLRTIYYAFFQPHINYGLINWSCASQTTLNPIKISQNKIIRILTFSDNDTPLQNLYNNNKHTKF